jgi:phage terminase small subunit
MPRLSNERLERFCRVYARKFDRVEAADVAGYTYGTAGVLCTRVEVQERVKELTENMLKAADITAQRVMLELGRVAFADIRKVFNPDGSLIPIHELDDDAAASIAGIEHETHSQVKKELVMNLETGELEPQAVVTQVRTAKIKRFNKDAALGTLAKHFKIVGDEGDGVNALASALADRLKVARTRVIENDGGDLA